MNIRLTLGLSKIALFNSRLDGLVELGIEGTLGGDGDLVVGSHVLLDGLAAIPKGKHRVSTQSRQRDATINEGRGRASEVNTLTHTWNHCALSTVYQISQSVKIITEIFSSNDNGSSCPMGGRDTVGRATRHDNKTGGELE